MNGHSEILKNYAQEVTGLYKTGVTTEHSFRGSLQTLLNALLPQYSAVNEPRRSACGAPDYALVGKKDRQPHAYIEAKDLFDNDLAGRQAKGHKEQFDRYKQALSRVAFTDYLDFRFFVDGEETAAVSLLKPNAKGGFDIADGELFVSTLVAWSDCTIQPITSSKRLAEVMAYKARLLREASARALESGNQTDIHSQYEAFRNVLLSDLTPDGFADLYAQTIAYGMFAARLNQGGEASRFTSTDQEASRFSRQEAATLIPLSNPFLRKIFQSIAGYDLDESIAWIVDDLAGAFAATHVDKIMGRYRQNALHQDPLIHFYEDFLAAYDPKRRKACGVYYTPQPVVSFIVRAIDEVLKRDFGLADGLADYSKTRHKVFVPQAGKMVEKQVHRVQILDPATGTGTFLAETVRQIRKVYEGNEGMWPQYVEESLRPRLHGFELLMAPYTITHLKLDMILGEATSSSLVQGKAASLSLNNQGKATSSSLKNPSRTRVYLTNSLEECHPDTGTLWASWLSNESAEANAIKRDCPVMVMMGNPPYSVSSSNKGEWITHLVDDYKRGLNERNIQPLSDDYIKFIRLGQHYIERNGTGVLGFITNNSYLDGLIHRQMRKTLLETFDDIYIVNLHGNSKRKETAPDGSKDENVFDIMVGANIAIFVETGKKGKKELCKVHYFDLFGTRNAKYDALNTYTLTSAPWQLLECKAPNYFFVPKDFGLEEEYNKGIKIDELFKVNSSGVKTHNDSDLVGFEKFESEFNQSYCYRPLDNRWIDYDLTKVVRHRYKTIHHLINDNIAFVMPRQCGTDWRHIMAVSELTDTNYISVQSKEANYLFPLYLYDEDGNRHLNMREEVVERFFARMQGEATRTTLEQGEATSSSLNKNNESDRMSLFLDRHSMVDVTRANLPHWHQDAKLQFVTFRLADSLPQEKLLQLKEDKDLFEKNHPKPWDTETEKRYYKLFGSKIDEWLDAGSGSCILRRPDVRKIVEETLRHFDGERYIIHSFVIMPNHIHVLFEPLGSNKTSFILQAWKGYSAKEANKLMGTSGTLWQKESFDRMIRDESHYRNVLKYIRSNPSRLDKGSFTLWQGEATSFQGEATSSSLNENNASDKMSLFPDASDKMSLFPDASDKMSLFLDASDKMSLFLDFFAYIYAVLHSPSYRECYKEFLKIDFPRIPLPTDETEYMRLVGLGKELIDLHLMRANLPVAALPKYPISGSNVVEKAEFALGGAASPSLPRESSMVERDAPPPRVYINGTQYFDGVSETAWSFFIGGYQPAQKWLKDRKGRTLSFEDIRHYQRIIATLDRTAEIMKEIG